MEGLKEELKRGFTRLVGGLIDRRHEVHLFGVGWWFKDGSRTIEYDGIILHVPVGLFKLYVNGRRSIKEANTLLV